MVSDTSKDYYILLDEIQMVESINNPYLPQESASKITFVDVLLGLKSQHYCIFGKYNMKLDYYLPSDPSRSLVIQYEHVQAEGENISVVDRHIPSGHVSLVFNSSGCAAIHEEPLIHLPRHFMVVPLFRAVNIKGEFPLVYDYEKQCCRLSGYGL